MTVKSVNGGLSVTNVSYLCSFTKREPNYRFCDFSSSSTLTASHLGLLKVQVLPDGSEQSAQALQRLFIVILQQLDHAVMHDGLSQHLQLKQLANEPYVADGAPSGFVLGFF